MSACPVFLTLPGVLLLMVKSEIGTHFSPSSPLHPPGFVFATSEQVGSGARSEKIRTYNWKDSRCSDHRIGKNFPLSNFLSGSGLDDMIGACILLDQQELMAELASKQRQGQGQEGAAASR